MLLEWDLDAALRKNEQVEHELAVLRAELASERIARAQRRLGPLVAAASPARRPAAQNLIGLFRVPAVDDQMKRDKEQ
jgi:hypothetical protein